MAEVLSKPIFGTLDDCKEAQRLSGMKQAGDVEQQFLLGLVDARTEFYMRLGLPRLQQLEALSVSDDPPTTNDHYLWLLAHATEQKIVRRFLLRYLTAIVREGSTRVFQEWNDTSAFRDLSQSRLRAEAETLSSEIERAFLLLAGLADPGQVPNARVLVVGSKLPDKYRVVGFSIYADSPFLFQFSLDHTNDDDPKPGIDP